MNPGDFWQHNSTEIVVHQIRGDDSGQIAAKRRVWREKIQNEEHEPWRDVSFDFDDAHDVDVFFFLFRKRKVKREATQQQRRHPAFVHEIEVFFVLHQLRHVFSDQHQNHVDARN